MKLSRIIFIIAVVIVGVWLLGLVIRLLGWVFNSLLYVAAAIVAIGLIRYWWEARQKPKTSNGRKVIKAEEVKK